MKTYGQIAYEAHAEIFGCVGRGATLPAWDDLDADTTNAWMAAGSAVDVQVRTDGIDPGDTRRGALEQLAAKWLVRRDEFRAAAKTNEDDDSARCQRAIAHHFTKCREQLLAIVGDSTDHEHGESSDDASDSGPF